MIGLDSSRLLAGVLSTGIFGLVWILFSLIDLHELCQLVFRDGCGFFSPLIDYIDLHELCQLVFHDGYGFFSP